MSDGRRQRHNSPRGEKQTDRWVTHEMTSGVGVFVVGGHSVFVEAGDGGGGMLFGGPLVQTQAPTQILDVSEEIQHVRLHAGSIN